eukprot:scaffold323692_cov15-Tisochrysis_lutea.AAC.1
MLHVSGMLAHIWLISLVPEDSLDAKHYFGVTGKAFGENDVIASLHVKSRHSIDAGRVAPVDILCQ